jgi:pilus assembly protein Flp/PilA
MKLLRQELARSAVGAMSQPKSFIDGEPKLCITLGDGTILFCAPPSEEFPRKIAGLSLLQAMPRSQAPVYLGMSLGAGQAMASSETLSGVIPNGGIPRLILKGKRYLEFRLKGQPPGQDQSISSIGGFQLYGGDAASIERPPKSAMLYSLQPDWVNGLLSFWADPLYKNGWDFVMLIPEDVFPGVPRFVFYNIEIHQVRRDLQIALIAQSQRESFQQTRVQLLSNEKSISLATTEQRSEGRTFQPQQEQVMSKFLATTKSFLTDDRGVTSIEYGLIASLLGVALVTVLGLLSTDLIAVFESIRAAI